MHRSLLLAVNGLTDKARRIGARVVGHVGDLCFKAGTNVENPYPLAMAAGLSDIILRALCILWPAES